MIIIDVIKNTPKIFKLVRLYFVDFWRFMLDVKSGETKDRYELVLTSITWSLAVILCANVLSKEVVGQNLLEFSVDEPGKTVIVNGSEVSNDSSPVPSRIEILYGPQYWFFDIGYRWIQLFRFPLPEPGKDIDCVVIASKHGSGVDAADTLRDFDDAKKFVDDSCKAGGRAYMIAADGPSITVIEGSGGYVSTSFKGPIAAWSRSDNAVLGRAYFGNGTYRIGFDYLDVRRFALVIPVLIVWIYGTTYAISCALVDRVFFLTPFRQSFDIQMVLITIPYTVGVVLVVGFLAFDQIAGTVPGAVVWLSVTAMGLFHLFRVGQSLGAGKQIPFGKRAGATVVSLILAWTVGGVFFLPAVTVVLVFHEGLTQLVN